MFAPILGGLHEICTLPWDADDALTGGAEGRIEPLMTETELPPALVT